MVDYLLECCTKALEGRMVGLLNSSKVIKEANQVDLKKGWAEVATNWMKKYPDKPLSIKQLSQKYTNTFNPKEQQEIKKIKKKARDAQEKLNVEVIQQLNYARDTKGAQSKFSKYMKTTGGGPHMEAPPIPDPDLLPENHPVNCDSSNRYLLVNTDAVSGMSYPPPKDAPVNVISVNQVSSEGCSFWTQPDSGLQDSYAPGSFPINIEEGTVVGSYETIEDILKADGNFLESTEESVTEEVEVTTATEGPCPLSQQEHGPATQGPRPQNQQLVPPQGAPQGQPLLPAPHGQATQGTGHQSQHLIPPQGAPQRPRQQVPQLLAPSHGPVTQGPRPQSHLVPPQGAPQGPRPQGPRPQGPATQGPRPQSHLVLPQGAPQGPRPQGPRPQGPRPQGPATQGPRPQSHLVLPQGAPQGPRPQGPRPQVPQLLAPSHGPATQGPRPQTQSHLVPPQGAPQGQRQQSQPLIGPSHGRATQGAQDPPAQEEDEVYGKKQMRTIEKMKIGIMKKDNALRTEREVLASGKIMTRLDEDSNNSKTMLNMSLNKVVNSMTFGLEIFPYIASLLL